ncbi:MAG: 30S ribosomal protein S20 [Okeania sp. SIO1H5]|uniref:30S ribosomal protein S20 n=1 Tax=Okeania sp. SIO1H5 TaxID=2607777 RepID=UPI0013B8E34D|nr:30S ribosomal protein S20 [Okeania sp. SIO1H5]NET23882.1 30S ribosomal protein S20 [Okeania sp. SIO1H5]
MPKNLSAVKRAQIALRNNRLNKNYKSSIKTMIKKIIALNSASTKSEHHFAKVQFLISQAYSKIDKAAKKGVIHKNTASRKKSRLANLFKLI